MCLGIEPSVLPFAHSHISDRMERCLPGEQQVSSISDCLYLDRPTDK